MARMIYINKDKDPLRRAQSTQFQADASHRLAGQIGMSAQYANVQKSFLQLNKDRLNMEWDAYQREKEQNQIIGYVTGAAQVVGGAAITAFGGGAAGVAMMINGGLTIGGTAAADELGDGVQKYFQMGQNLVNLGSQVYGAYAGYVNQKKELKAQQDVSDYEGYMAQAAAAAMSGEPTANPYKDVELKDIYGKPILDSNGNPAIGPQGFSNFKITTRDGKTMTLGEFARNSIADVSDIPLVPGFMEGNQTRLGAYKSEAQLRKDLKAAGATLSGNESVGQLEKIARNKNVSLRKEQGKGWSKNWADAISLRDTRLAARFIAADAKAMQNFLKASMEGEQDLFNMRLQEATSQKEIQEILESNGMLSPEKRKAMEQIAVTRLNRKYGVERVRETTANYGPVAGREKAREEAGKDAEALREYNSAVGDTRLEKRKQLADLAEMAFNDGMKAQGKISDGVQGGANQAIINGGQNDDAKKAAIEKVEDLQVDALNKKFNEWGPAKPHSLDDLRAKRDQIQGSIDYDAPSKKDKYNTLYAQGKGEALRNAHLAKINTLIQEQEAAAKKNERDVSGVYEDILNNKYHAYLNGEDTAPKLLEWMMANDANLSMESINTYTTKILKSGDAYPQAETANNYKERFNSAVDGYIKDINAKGKKTTKDSALLDSYKELKKTFNLSITQSAMRGGKDAEFNEISRQYTEILTSKVMETMDVAEYNKLTSDGTMSYMFNTEIQRAQVKGQAYQEGEPGEGSAPQRITELRDRAEKENMKAIEDTFGVKIRNTLREKDSDSGKSDKLTTGETGGHIFEGRDGYEYRLRVEKHGSEVVQRRRIGEKKWGDSRPAKRKNILDKAKDLFNGKK